MMMEVAAAVDAERGVCGPRLVDGCRCYCSSYDFQYLVSAACSWSCYVFLASVPLGPFCVFLLRALSA